MDQRNSAAPGAWTDRGLRRRAKEPLVEAVRRGLAPDLRLTQGASSIPSPLDVVAWASLLRIGLLLGFGVLEVG